MHRNLPAALWFQMKLRTCESSGQVSPLGFSVTLSSRSQPPLRDMDAAAPGNWAGSTARRPAPPRLEQWACSGGRGNLVCLVATMTGFPGSLPVLDFISLPKRWQGGSTALSSSHQGHSRGTGERHLARKPHNAAGTCVGSPCTSTTSLTCCRDHWTSDSLHAECPLHPCQQHCHWELQTQRLL